MNPRQSSQTSSDPTPASTSDFKGSLSKRSRRRKLARSKRKQPRRLSVEGLERRQLLAANPIGPITTFDEFEGPRNVGSVTSFTYTEREGAVEIGENDSPATAELIPLGTGSGDRDTIEVSGNVSFQPGSAGGFITDLDYYKFNLDAGDVLDIATLGAVSAFQVYTPDGQLWLSQDAPVNQNQNDDFSFYPINSPLQTLGNTNLAQVAPFEGTYTIGVAAENTVSNYTLGLRAYRPVTESLPVGQSQIVFLDFDGGVVPRDVFNSSLGGDGGFEGGVFVVRPFAQTLRDAGVVVAQDPFSPNTSQIFNSVATTLTNIVEKQFADLGNYTGNGSYNNIVNPVTGTFSPGTFNPGDFGITILNSFEHAEPSVDIPFTRVMFGSVESFDGITNPPLGISQTIDVGNFDLNETVIVFVDNEVAAVAGVDRAANLSEFDVLGLELGATTTHELGHSFGLYHTDGGNGIPSLIDGGGDNDFNGLGVGLDGIVGTADDMTPRFLTDFSDPGGVVDFGILYSGESLAYALSTGTSGSGGGTAGAGVISGTVFNDVDGNGVSTGDPGLAGVTVFLDINGNGIQDSTDPSTISGTDGSFAINGPPGTFSLLAVTPSNLVGSTSVTSSQIVAISATSGATSNFLFSQVNADASGRKFADLNNNGIYDIGEPGVEGAYIYADLDGDNRPDLFEPFDITDGNGLYELSLQSIGSAFAIREVTEPGFERTVPLSGEYIVNYTGSPLGNTFNFGGLPSRDFGDAPDTYLTTVAAGGPSHGISESLRIGATVDRELDGSPDVNALGDDQINASLSQIDDEDGVILVRPLSLISTGRFEVSLTNSTGSAGYLQGWVDFNADGDFLDAGEQVVTNLIQGTGTATIDVPLPIGFNINADGSDDGLLDTFARFRYSLTPGLGVGGPADTGEVEDHAVRILQGGDLANDDTVTVPQNATGFEIDVLANDFNLPSSPLTIINASNSTAGGVVTIKPGLAGQQSLLYTPRDNFTGRDFINYTVRDQAGNIGTAMVEVIVTFQTAAPIAIDDLYEVPSSESNFPLNVLDNDIASVQGGLTIESVSNGSQDGLVTLTPGNRGLRYTPTGGFTGSEQFVYSVRDASGQVSSATVTIVLSPQALEDDKAEFKVEILDQNNDTELLTLQAGQTFRVRVSVDDIDSVDSDLIQGLQSAYTDLLYTAGLVTPVESNPNDSFPFDITFGPKFDNVLLGNSLNPGIIDEVGATQSFSNLSTIGSANDLASHTGFAELFTITMRATGSGVAEFQTDPNESGFETVLVTEIGTTPVGLTFDEIRYGSVNIPIVPAGDGFPGALDDSFPQGVDSLGQSINSGSIARFNVLENDIIGVGDTVIEVGLREAPVNGNATVNTQGTADPSDDFIQYSPNPGFQGFDQFSYILTVESDQFGTVSSIANVSLVVGEIQNAQAQYDFTFVDETGNPITSVATGQRFGVRIDAIDLDSGRPPTDAVFAGFLDILYSSNLIETIAVDNGGNSDIFDFDVEFDPQFLLAPAVGTNDRPGLIDEFGSNQGSLGGSGTTLATIYFNALQPGQATVTGSPADRFPFQDTLLDQNDNPVPIENIVYDSKSILITGSIASPEPLQNVAMPADVNDDNLVTAIDALIIINEMSRLDAEGEFAATSGGRTYFHDVNGDGLVTAIDALRVINQLNGQDVGSSEPSAPAQAANNTSDFDSLIVDSIDVLADEAKIVDDSASVEDASIVSVAAESSQSNDDDDDDLLSLLADDIAKQ